MKTALLTLCGGLALTVSAMPAFAALDQGVKAPEFVTTGALAGQSFSFDLDKALKKGPVVLYFFPKAFTQGCTLESNAFAEAMDDFHKAGAQVIGLSADDIPTLKRFSTEECRDAFPVGQATPAIISDYDVAMVMKGKATGMSDRTSYVIGQDGRVVMVHSDLDWRQHVARTLKAVQSLHH
ncbi:peroxiredoxin [Altericroceibacterium spongiae]|uniref:thioredoxin-dependent peroxiredoxin n=1 Tax=Altericroceibacterium spongiae TaxID=2320269 RepID=A0A420ES78_9SPHN|nr:peroxiredoxin [Altericroceibacterium spongiae]RKF23586.1 peroxiredoxin [Altericroceibacterium spongiae]